MTLAEETKEAVFAWLETKGVRSDCPACGCKEWEVGDIIAPPATPHGGGTAHGGPSFPLVQLCCQRCGFVMHFNSTRIGLPV